jgi:hypothetical protein
VRQVSLSLQIAAIVAVAYMGLVMVNRRLGERMREQQPKPPDGFAEFERAYGGSAVKIVQFYSREGTMFEGSTTVLCYGVANARSVRMEPPVEGVSVSINNCVEVSPERDTRYTLTAEGNDGHAVSESFVLKVRPDPATLPKITSFRITKHETDHGRHIFSIAFAQQNGELVDIDPPAFPTLHGAPNGSFYVSPEKTTTYTLTVTGKKGRQAKRQLTVEVPGN